ncbi:HAD family hydrolase [Paenibacillus polymyxa]|uniref:HAD-IIB family hydrolase n=1 Tax=Paenibacillus polymyxa TaxID=1406 RepID=UPI0010BE7682|nr:HAD-IIB family hydrolase [Paenibacillus polymyxa]TKH39975.1 HAD family hydrolase [Paenibacillus polymyxa]
MHFVFDLDGTICFKGQCVSDKIAGCLEQLTQAGHEVIFASARPIRDMLPVLPERFYNYTLIGGNGSMISQKGSVKYVESFLPEVKNALLTLLEEHQATYLIDSEWDYAYTGAADHPILNNVDVNKLAQKLPLASLKSIVKILILTADDMEGLATKLLPLGVVIHQHRNEQVLDISPQNIHKWNALQKLGVQPRQFIAFGNDANDIPMFKEAHHAVMVHHHAELAAYATESIPDEGENQEDQIIAKIRELAGTITV